MRLILLVLGNILALFLASQYVTGVALKGGVGELVVVGLVLSIINFFLKPILKLVLGPFILLSFGLFIIVINMGILWVTDLILPQLEITTFGALFLATLLIAVVNFAVHILVRR